MADVFTAIPAYVADHPEADIPPFNMGEEFKQILAIHIFDNLYPGLGAPSQEPTAFDIAGAKYRLVKPPGSPGDLPMGGDGSMWLPWSVDAEALRVGSPPDPEGLPDIDLTSMTPEQLLAFQAKIDNQLIAHEQARGTDKPIEIEEPEFMRFRAERLAQLEDKLVATTTGPTEVDLAAQVEADPNSPVPVFEPEDDDR